MKRQRPDDVWIVCGTRTATDYEQVAAVLNRIRDKRGLPRRLFHGACAGVDQLAAWWADNQAMPPEIEVVAFPPEGPKPAAFHVRNRAMAAEAARYRRPRCIALPAVGIRSKGTQNMVTEASLVGISSFVFPIHLPKR